jgi:Thioredoxin reductase
MPGFPEVLAKDLAQAMIRQAMRFKPTVCLEQRAETLTRTDDGWAITTHTGQVHHTRTVVICAGAGAFSPRKLNAEGVAEFEGNGVFYGVRDKSVFAGKRLLIVGGGDSAVDWALNLYPIAQAVTLIHRRDEFRAHEQSVHELRQSPVNILTPYELRRVCGNGTVERAVIFHNKTQNELELPVDAVILNLGFVATLGPIKSWGLELQGNQIVVDEYMQTNLPASTPRAMCARMRASSNSSRRASARSALLSTTPRASSTPLPRCSLDTAATWSCPRCEPVSRAPANAWV